MLVRIITYEQDETTGEQIAEGVATEFQAEHEAAVGSGPDCAVQATGLPPEAFRLRAAADGGRHFELAAVDAETEIRVNDTVVAGAEPVALKSGDRIAAGGRIFHFQVRFEPAAQGWRARLLPTLTAALVALVLAVEVGLIWWLPERVKEIELGGIEMMRQQTMRRLDELRLLAGRQAGSGASPVRAATVGLIGEELDNMAFHLREYAHKMDRRQLRQMYSDLAAYQEALAALRRGELPPAAQTLDVKDALRQILAKEESSETGPSPGTDRKVQ